MTPRPDGLPNLVFIGAARAGTTSLARYLDGHPDVFVTPAKEINYFDLRWHRDIAWYRTYFQDATTEKVVVDASVSYMVDPEAPARMKTVVPDAQLLALLRHPVDRAYSHYWFRRFWGAETRPFEVAIREHEGETDPQYLDRGRYLVQLQRVLEHYDRDRLLVLLLDDLRADSGATFGRLCEFIGVDPTAAPVDVGRTYNSAQVPRSDIAQRAIRSLMNRRRIPRHWGRRLSAMNMKDGDYPPLDGALRAELLETFRADNEALGNWLGRDLSRWNT
jgi:hypothetical protein